MKSLVLGHVLLIICCLFYLVWWCYSFRPGFEGSRIAGLSGVFLLITALAGLSGAGLTVMGIQQPDLRPELIPSGYIVIGGIVLYVLLFAGSSAVMHRQVTTELLLIIGWLVLEYLSFQSAYCAEQMNFNDLRFLLIIVSAAAILSLFFYLQYYRVGARIGFVFGMIPLITEALCMIAFLAICWSKDVK